MLPGHPWSNTQLLTCGMLPMDPCACLLLAAMQACWLLLEKGADPSSMNDDEETPQQLGPESWSWWGPGTQGWQQLLQNWRQQQQQA